ncbi:serine/threonine protein kinase [Nostoc spongiaeforme FACHB-130]|uniref:Serine/threonine protein kinase n=1 Tax=Nostoc spongiaeforme FACHB-130 TaxID=1357510 RepID=A0ABR8FS80_9NOSO|nr:serine/threonine-protein kinase [Nostoc spongiaeforme]MBD2593696.1 serine/threonine protein kinase [Nostoc spongiaeforme FACHB-130]
MAWVAGDQLQGGKYTIERELGKGRFGITYLVKNRNSDRLVIKTLNDDLLQSLSPDERARLENMFYDEAFKLRGCKHNHIVQITELFREGEYPCLVMEYIGEDSLANLRPSILSEPDALRYIQQIGEALIEVHNKGLIHRDVHPGNILLRKRDGNLEAVLIDFGLALNFDHILTTSRTQETSEGFTPPELYARGNTTQAYSDIYSLAATLYKLLTGRTPVGAVKRKADGEHLVSPKEYNPQITKKTNDAILAGMQLDPKQRPQSMQEWLNSLGLTGSKIETTKPLKPKAKIDWVAITAIGTLLAGIGAMAAWYTIFKPSPPPPPTVTSPPSSKTP